MAEPAPLRTPPAAEPAAPAPVPARPSGTHFKRASLATQVEVHDRQQVEVRFNYAIGSDSGPQRYTVDTYFFIPRNVGVNRANFSREGFYADVTALMRLDAATLPLEKLGDEKCPESPLFRFAQSLEAFRTSPRPPPSRPVSVHVKLYAYLYAGAVKTELARIHRRLKECTAGDGQKAKELEAVLLETLGRLRGGLIAYRRVRAAYWPFERLCHHSLVEAMRAADEYMSLLLEEKLSLLVSDVEADVKRRDGTGFVARIRLQVAELAREEAAYRLKYGYLTLTQDQQRSEGEYFTYRAGLLKKTVQQALYLDPREVRVDTFLRNAVGAVAAALAAIWATALAMQLPGLTGNVSSGTKTLLFAAAVVAYVLKDRIKAMTGEYLGRRLRKHDHTSWLYGDSLETVGLGMLQARLREAMRFLSLADVPADIMRTRLSRRTVRNAEHIAEEVIYYRKTLDVGTRDDSAPLPEGYWVRDILRLNVRHFLVRLDDPLDRVDYFDHRTGAFRKADLPKVYHLNVVVKLTRENADGTGEERLEHLRVVLNKDGIVRCEQVDAMGPHPLPDKRPRFTLPIGLRLPFFRR